MNPHLFEKPIKAPKGHIFKWNHGVKQKITKYQKDYKGYLQYKNWGAQKPDPLKLVDWDGATELPICMICSFLLPYNIKSSPKV